MIQNFKWFGVGSPTPRLPGNSLSRWGWLGPLAACLGILQHWAYPPDTQELELVHQIFSLHPRAAVSIAQAGASIGTTVIVCFCGYFCSNIILVDRRSAIGQLACWHGFGSGLTSSSMGQMCRPKVQAGRVARVCLGRALQLAELWLWLRKRSR